MNIATYQTLTGITVSTANQAQVTAQINRTKAMLETLLGYPLCSSKGQKNLYNELGKTQLECSAANIDTATLDDPDEVEGNYRLFEYVADDKYFHVDPFSTIYKVKLVFIRSGDLFDNGITIKTFDPSELRVHMGHNGFSKYIEHCVECLCYLDCTDCVQLAVDADWVWPNTKCIPSDLQYLWADMITHYTDCKRNIKSESITTHSYTKFDNTAPELLPTNLTILRKYAGPHGSVNTVFVV